MFHFNKCSRQWLGQGNSKGTDNGHHTPGSDVTSEISTQQQGVEKVQPFCTTDQKRYASMTQTTSQQKGRVELLRERSEYIWRAAENLREDARGFGDGDPDSIQEIMNRYAIYRFYAAYDDPKRNMIIRHQKASAMIHDIVSSPNLNLTLL